MHHLSPWNGVAGEGPGDLFVKSDGWKTISDPTNRGQRWSTGPIEVGLTKAGTIFESGQGAGVVPVPQVVPGIVSKLFQPLGIADLFAQGQTSTPTVRYMLEGTATSGAAGVAEGGDKPGSDIAISVVDEPVRKIATTLGPISDEILEDAVQIQQYLNSRLTLFCTIEEERQLLRGTGTNELVGVFGRSINTYTRLAADDNATSLARVISNTAGSSFLMPDTIIMHPTNWLNTRLLRDGLGGTAGQFLGGGPFTGAYGNGGAADAGMFGQQLWNTRVALSTFVGVGTALVGNFGQAAQIWRRGGRTVEAANQHSDWFSKDLVMIRAESRAALAVYRPTAFTAVSGLA